MKKTLTITVSSVLISYLFNCYAYNSFNSANFPIEAKYLSSFGVLIIIAITTFIKDETIKLQSEKIDDLFTELDKLKTK